MDYKEVLDRLAKATTPEYKSVICSSMIKSAVIYKKNRTQRRGARSSADKTESDTV